MSSPPTSRRGRFSAASCRREPEDGGFDCYTRALVLQALRRSLLRESVLLRLLTQSSEFDDSGWGELLARAFFANLPQQHESMAQRIAVFLEDLKIPGRWPPGNGQQFNRKCSASELHRKKEFSVLRAPGSRLAQRSDLLHHCQLSQAPDRAWRYLSDMMRRLPAAKNHEIPDLAPARWKPAQA